MTTKLQNIMNKYNIDKVPEGSTHVNKWGEFYDFSDKKDIKKPSAVGWLSTGVHHSHYDLDRYIEIPAPKPKLVYTQTMHDNQEPLEVGMEFYIEIPKPKLVYTQDMHTDGEPLEVGMECLVHNVSGKFNVVLTENKDGYVVLSPINNKTIWAINHITEVRPIPDLTDKEKEVNKLTDKVINKVLGKLTVKERNGIKELVSEAYSSWVESDIKAFGN